MSVVHCKKAPFDVYIGRPSKWGNPFSDDMHSSALYLVGSRGEAVARYREWLLRKPELLAAAKVELAGKVLGCWCKPYACHGDVLSEIANSEIFL